MDINSISNYASTTAATTAKTTAKKDDTSSASTVKTDDTAAVYEKTSSTNADYKASNSALIAKLKADSNNRVAQLEGIVKQMMTKQGSAIGNADSMWQFLAGGNFTVDAATKAQAQADIAEDGYWGVTQTSDRIVDFAKALSGNDSSKAEELLNAFKKGFQEATKSWGGTLPSISQDTYDAVIKKFDEWTNSEVTE